MITKISLLATRLTGQGGGSALPGLLAEKLDPNFAKKFRKQFKTVVLITGTNGKTTTTKMLVEMLRATGHPVLTNQSGSNLKRGLVSSLIMSANWRGKLAADTAIIEVDEASLPAISEVFAPTHVAVLNLFRDQLDRYGELESTAQILRHAIESNPKAQLLLNADDPLVASLATSSKHVQYFGIESSNLKRLAHDITADSAHSPVDGTPLKYTKNWFGHLGHYASQDGTFVRPNPEYAAKQDEQSLRLTLGEAKSVTVELPLPGLYNAYNALAASALAASLGVDTATISATLSQTKAAFGRVESFQLHNRTVYLLLIKNPTGFNQVIQTFLTSPKPKSNTLLVINDNFADGRDVSWLWDVAIEEIAGKQPIVVSGLRAADMALRLKYAGRPSQLINKPETAFTQALRETPDGGTLYVLPTYTAMLGLRKWLASQVSLEDVWNA